jgi:hypothetical protein
MGVEETGKHVVAETRRIVEELRQRNPFCVRRSGVEPTLPP